MDATAQSLVDTFGFRGVNFGNWVPDKERQAHLNASFEAFMDLTSLLGLTPRDMSLGGLVGLAIGAQGGGKFAGHFVPGVNEVNFTRTAGAGVAAHEWAHALDHRLAVAAGAGHGERAFLTEFGPLGPPAGMGGTFQDVTDAMGLVVMAMLRKPASPADRAEDLARLRNPSAPVSMFDNWRQPVTAARFPE